jgi:hypothetical protein
VSKAQRWQRLQERARSGGWSKRRLFREADKQGLDLETIRRLSKKQDR